VTERKTGSIRKELWGSVEGVIEKGSLVRDEEGASAVLVDEDGVRVRVKGYGDAFSGLVETAADAGGNVIFQGHIRPRGEGDPVRLAVRIMGPVELTGKVSDIRRSAEGAEARIGFWMMREIASSEGEVHLFGTGVNVSGPDADALSGLREGDRVRLEARHGEEGFIATSPVSVLPSQDIDEPTM